MNHDEIIAAHYAALGEAHIQATGGWLHDVEARKDALEKRRAALRAKGFNV